MFQGVGILAAVLAVAFFLSGVSKLARPRGLVVRPVEATLGVLEILGAVGLVLPQILGVAVFLVPTAAVAFSLLMVGALVFHVRRRERQPLPVIATLMGASLWVGLAWPVAP